MVITPAGILAVVLHVPGQRNQMIDTKSTFVWPVCCHFHSGGESAVVNGIGYRRSGIPPVASLAIIHKSKKIGIGSVVSKVGKGNFAAI